MKHIASVSFGKDSLAMLLRLIEEKKPLDEVVFYNTGMEFTAVYKLKDKIIPLLEKNGIKYTELKPTESFEYKMFKRPVNGKNGKHYGYSWCGGRCRWGTTEKLKALDNYCGNSIQYIGIAFDEPQRIERAEQLGKKTPLVEWEMTEKDCLEYCHNRGYFWREGDVELYDVLDRVSCWCCANKNLKELKNYYKYLPTYWALLKIFQSKTERPFKKSGTIFELEKRFEREEINNV